MCGHVGIAGDLHYQDEFTMKRMLLFDYFRGPDSTGMGAVRTNGDIVCAKLASNPIDFFNLESFKKALNGNGSRAFIGHNRLSTRGKVNTVNAHPFHVDHIIMAHNGTLDYSSFKRLKDALGEDFEVDSMALAHAIARFGIKKTIEMCTTGKDTKEGAWALVWFDQKRLTLNFLRNKHRQLYYCFEEGFKRMFWASEWWMLREAMETSENKYKVYTEADGDTNVGFFTFDEDVHYEFDLDALCKGSKKRPKPVCKKMAGREPDKPAPFGFGQSSGSASQVGSATDGTHTTIAGIANSTPKTNSGASSTTTYRGANDAKKRSVAQLRGSPEKPYAGIIDEDKFAMVSYEGCSWCDRAVPYGEPGVTIFECEGRILCRDCSGYEAKHPMPASKIFVRSNVFDTIVS